MSSSRDAVALDAFHPLVRAWFTETLGSPSAPQREGWPAIASGAHTLVLAPTGTGKTLAAFLWELNALIVDGADAPLPNAIRILYVSPLKALNNDIQRNLERPLAELRQRFERAGEAFPEIRVAVRTGDTPTAARARMLRKTPHILITTPESLNIMLTSMRGRGMFSDVRVVIVDEIHAVAGTKRGVHLALQLERLEALSGRSPQRIGLSATVRPISEMAWYLAGTRTEDRGSGSVRDATPGQQPPPSVRVVDCGLVKQLDIAVRAPVLDMANVGGSVWPKVIGLVLDRVREGRRVTIAPWMADAEVTVAATALLAHLRASAALGGRPRDVEVETIDGLNAAATKWTDAFLKAGFRRETSGLRGF